MLRPLNVASGLFTVRSGTGNAAAAGVVPTLGFPTLRPDLRHVGCKLGTFARPLGELAGMCQHMLGEVLHTHACTVGLLGESSLSAFAPHLSPCALQGSLPALLRR
jgi:hypothetical protein